jgi:hypothetical protein
MHIRARRSINARRFAVAALLVAGSISGLIGATALAFGAQVPEWNEVPLEAGTYRQQTTAHRTDTVDIPVGPNGGEIEYMIKMRRGDSLVYSWRAVEIASPERLTSEFHGHTERAPGTTGTLIFYRKASGASENGSLVAPFDGTHGWYLKNDTDRPVVVRLALAGFYDVIPGQLPN